jgi:hypothetical protein
VGRGNRAYKSAKRNKELHRLKKQEEKRLRRMGKLKSDEESEAAPAEGGGESAAVIETGADSKETET